MAEDGQVKFLERMLPRIEPMKHNATVLSQADRSVNERSEAVRLLLEDLCTCFRTFDSVKLPDVLGASSKVAGDYAVRDTSWLLGTGVSLDIGLRDRGLQWPPPDLDPPAIAQELASMYTRAQRAAAAGPVSAAMLKKIMRPVGRRACDLASSWSDGSVRDPEEANKASAFATGAQPLGISLTLIATVAQALTFPGAVAETMQMMQAMGLTVHEVIGLVESLGFPGLGPRRRMKLSMNLKPPGGGFF